MSFLKIKDPSKRDKLSLNVSKPRKKFKMIFSQNDWMNNHFVKISEKSLNQLQNNNKCRRKMLFPNLNFFRKQSKIHQRCKHSFGDHRLKHFMNFLLHLI